MKSRNLIILGAIIFIGAAVAVRLFIAHSPRSPKATQQPRDVVLTLETNAAEQKLEPAAQREQAAAVASTPPSMQTTAALSNPALTNFPAAIAPIVESNRNMAERQERVRALSRNLSAPELDALYSFLRARQPEDEIQSGHSLKNDVMEVLCAQDPLPKDLVGVFAAVYSNQTQNVVIRDYALQHLAVLYGRLSEQSSLNEAEVSLQRSSVQQLLWDATSETDSSIGGTALLALSRLARTGAPTSSVLDSPRLSRTALNLAGASDTGVLTRIAAIHVCANQQVEEALPLLRKTIEEAQDVSTRIAAIAALGALGGKSEFQFLEHFAGTEANPRLKPATELALRRMRQKFPEF